MVAVISGSGMAAFVILQLRSEEGWHHEIFVPDPVYRVRDFFDSWKTCPMNQNEKEEDL